MQRLQAFKFELMPNGEQHVVGAINVVARGHRVAACAEEGSGLARKRKRKPKPASMKQEPTDVTMCERTHA